MRRWFMGCGLLLWLGLSPVVMAAPASFGFQANPYRESMQHCRKITQESLRKELLKICKDAFEQNQVPFLALVEKQWTRQKMDGMIEKVVEKAAKRVSNEYGYFSRIKSSFSKTKAKEMAEKMARYAFSNELFNAEMKKLSQTIAGQLNGVIHEKAKLSINRSIECINQFLKSKYNDVIKDIFREQLASSFSKKNDPKGKLYSLPSVLGQRAKGLAGVGILITHQIARLIAKRIAKRIASRLAQSLGMRIATRIGTKFIPWVGWGLLAWDVWDLARAKGSIPEIKKSLMSEKVRVRMRNDISSSIKDSFESNYRTIVRQVSDSIYNVWIHFQKRFQHVLRLADKEDSFRTALKNIKQMTQLYFVVHLYSVLGEPALVQISRSGQLLALIENPYRDELMALLRFRPDVHLALAWSRLAGMNLRKVVAFEIFKHKNPSNLPLKTLNVLLSLEHPEQVGKLLLLPNEQIDLFHEISTTNRRKLIRRLNTNQLRLTTRYIKNTQGEKRNELISTLLGPPSQKLQILERPKVAALIHEASEKVAMVRFFLSNQPMNDLQQFRQLPIKAYFVKYGRWATYVLIGILIFLLPLLILIGVWTLRLSLGTYRLFFRLLIPKAKKKSPSES